jgi:DNA-binding GntR family transcriptional regulator
VAPAKRASSSVEADSSGHRTRYLDVAEQLLAEIEDGRYEVGSKLPTEAELCYRFGVSRSTIRQALGEIENSGVVERRQGSGTTLIARRRLLRYVLSATSENDLLRYAADTSLTFSGSAEVPDVSDCRRLHLDVPSNWRRWQGVRSESVGGPPIGLTSIYVPTAYADVMKHVGGTQRRAIFELVLSRFDLVLTQIDQVISATVLDAEEARKLEADPGTPALVITRRYSTASGLIEVAENVHPADRFSYEIRLERDPSSDRAVWPGAGAVR